MFLGGTHFSAGQGHRLKNPFEAEFRLLIRLSRYFGLAFRSLYLGLCGIAHANVRSPLIILGSDGVNPENRFGTAVNA